MIAIISDVHGNYPALQAVLSEATRLGCRRVISLGDVTGYYAEPDKCIDLLLKWQAIQLLGNHDEYLVEGSGCPRSRLVTSLLEHQAKVVRDDQLKVLSELSSFYEEGNACFVHGGWEDNRDEYLYKVSSFNLYGSWKFYFSGHTHVQTLAFFKDKIYCNPGSVGQPRDGDPRAAFAIFDGVSISLKRVTYDIEKTIEAMRTAGYTESKLWDNLYVGAQIGGRIDKIEIIKDL